MNKTVIFIVAFLVVLAGAGFFIANRGGGSMQTSMNNSQSASPMATMTPQASPT